MKSSTKTLIKALEVLAQEIQSPDGVANAAIIEAAERLRELSNDVLAKRIVELTAQVSEQGKVIEHIAKSVGCESDPFSCWEIVDAIIAERDALQAQVQKLQTENKGLLTANSKLCQTKDQQGYVNALEAALDCLQFTALLELDEHDMPNLKTVLLDSMQIRDELGDDANQLRQQAKGE